MSIQQQISRDVLFFKHRKLFYVMCFNQQKHTYKITDNLLLSQKILKSNNTTFINQDINIYPYSFSINESTTKNIQETLLFHTSAYNNEQNLDIIEKSFLQNLQINSIGQKTGDDQIQSKQFSDDLNFYDSFNDTQTKHKNHQNNININDSFSFKTNRIADNINIDDIIKDDTNAFYVLNDSYKIFVQFENKNINIEQYKIQNSIAKDLICNINKNNNIYLKIYNNDDVLIKRIQLQPTFNFNINITDCKIYRDYITFNSNNEYLSYNNIYHGNSLCRKYRSHLNKQYNILKYDLPFKIMSGNFKIINNKYALYCNNYIIVRLYFNNYVYVKNISVYFSYKNAESQISFRYSLLQQSINNFCFQSYNNNNFYCRFLQIKINYNSLLSSILQYIQCNVYNMNQKDLVFSSSNGLSSSNIIFLNRQNIIPENKDISVAGTKAKQQYNPYILGYNTTNYFNLINIDSQSNSHGLQSLDENNYSQIQFALDSNYINGVYNDYKYIYLQYYITQKTPTNVFNIQYFSINGVRNNFPKIVSLNISEYTIYFYHLSTQIGKNLQYYKQKWIYYSPLSNDNGLYNNAYFYFSYQKLQTDNDNYSWKTYQTIYVPNVVQSIKTQINNSNISFLDYDVSKGFILKVNVQRDNLYTVQQYTLNAKQKQNYYLKIFTSQLQSNTQYIQKQLIVDNQFNTTSKTKRNFYIQFKDGDDTHVSIYNIIIQNYLPSSGNIHCNKINKDFYLNTSNNQSSSSSSIINNNFYNIMYCINYLQNSNFNGTLIDGNETYLDKSQYSKFSKNNLHIQWDSNYKFQYLVMFDRFDKTNSSDVLKYKDYFLPFYNYLSSETIYSTMIQQNFSRYDAVVIKFQKYFEQSKIIVSIDLPYENILQDNIKCEYFYSYSNDGANWSEQLYYKPFTSFTAKYFIVTCYLYGDNQKIYLPVIDHIDIKYVDSDIYYLTDNNYVETSQIIDISQNTKYLLMIRTLYNGQILQDKLKLIQIQNFEIIQTISDLYVDDKKYNGTILKISGYDNNVNINFICYNGIKFNIKFYKIITVDDQQTFQLIDDLYLTNINSTDNYYTYNYSLPNICDKSIEKYSYKIRYYDQSYNVSEYSEMVKFYFNNIPTQPTNLDVINTL